MSPRRSARPAFLVSALICALVLLAVLQYRWSGQVSEAERLRMQSSLQLAVDQFRREFSRDLLSVGAGLQADQEATDSNNWEAVAQTQAEWLSSASNSYLVSTVYLWRFDDRVDGTLFRLDPAQGKYTETKAAAELEPVLSRLAANLEEHHPGPPRSSAWVMDGNAPVLIRSLSQFTQRSEQRSQVPENGPPSDRRIAYQLLLLNRDFIAKRLLPELAARHFAGPEGFIYQAQVYPSGRSAMPIYNSSGSQVLKPSDADLDTDLVDVRPLRGGPERGSRDHPRPPFRDWMRREGRSGPPDLPRAFAAPMLISDGVAPWRLAVRHRAGSVAAAVETLRWRNLGVTFAILLVLGASMITIVRNTQRAQKLAELQMDFVAGVSHELRTPLAVISSAAENLTDGVVQGEGQVKQYGSLIRNESRRLAGMMEQILQFAAGQKRQPYKPVALSVHSLIEGALGLSQTTLNEGGFTVERHVEQNLPQVQGESGALTQCLQNLISNAAKYSGDSRWLGIRAAITGGSVSITVEDRGIGIEESDLPHVFDAFYRAKEVRSAQIHGTGLGLNLARSFARDAGGEITVESTVGQGSRFTLTLPANPPDSAEPARLVNQAARLTS